LSGKINQQGGYYYLQGRSQLPQLRRQRYVSSQPKWSIARRVAGLLFRIPTISAVFVTGALSMDNTPQHDDIDLMIVTTPNTLWITRFFVVLLLRMLKLRRDPGLPEHSSDRVSNKICDNLWLDSDHLSVQPHSLYIAHEVLQAKCLLDRRAVYSRFLRQNEWVKDFLPIAYSRSVYALPDYKPSALVASLISIACIPVNLIFFILQYLYMKPGLTREKVHPGFAYFHPREETAHS